MTILAALLWCLMALLAGFTLVLGVGLLAMSYTLKSVGKLDPQFKEPRNEC